MVHKLTRLWKWEKRQRSTESTFGSCLRIDQSLMPSRHYGLSSNETSAKGLLSRSTSVSSKFSLLLCWRLVATQSQVSSRRRRHWITIASSCTMYLVRSSKPWKATICKQSPIRQQLVRTSAETLSNRITLTSCTRSRSYLRLKCWVFRLYQIS